MPSASAGMQSPTSKFALFEFSDSLTQAAPRPCRASRMAATTFGMPVSAASTSVPIITSEMSQRRPSDCAASTIAVAPPTTAPRAGTTGNTSGDQGGQAEQGGDVEDVGADHDADARALVAGDDRCHGRRDFRRVGAERRHHSEQRFGEAEALADAVELTREHEAGGDREDEPAD